MLIWNTPIKTQTKKHKSEAWYGLTHPLDANGNPPKRYKDIPSIGNKIYFKKPQPQ